MAPEPDSNERRTETISGSDLPPRASAPSFLIFGAGALGSLFGAKLAMAGNPVTLLGRPAHIQAIRERGLLVTGSTEGQVELEVISSLKELPPSYQVDYILIMVKAYDTPEAARVLSGWLEAKVRLPAGPAGKTIIVSLQNGLDNLTVLASQLGLRPLLGGLTSHGATFVDWGHIHHAGIGYTVVGRYDGNASVKRGEPEAGDDVGDVVGDGSANKSMGHGHCRDDADDPDGARKLALALANSGIPTSITPDLTGEIWAKGLVNCAINPVTALSGMANGALLQGPLRQLARQACQEGAMVARAVGVTIPGDDPWERVERVIGETAQNHSSMLQDIQRGRRTEIDAISGAVVKLGTALGVATPVNNTLWRLVQGIEAP